MMIEKITADFVDTTASKKITPKFTQVAKEIIQNSPKKLTNALDCLAAGKKAMIKQKKLLKEVPTKEIVEKITTVKDVISEKAIAPHPTAKSLAYEAVHNGANAQEAVNGAKAAMAAISEPVGFSAKQSAQTFIEAGPSKFEKKLDLQAKYGEKLQKAKAQKAADLALKNDMQRTVKQLSKVDELLK